MSFYQKLEFTKSGRLKRGEMKKLTEEEKHQYYLDYNKKYYAKMKPYEVRKNKKIQNEEGVLMTNVDFLKESERRELVGQIRKTNSQMSDTDDEVRSSDVKLDEDELRRELAMTSPH